MLETVPDIRNMPIVQVEEWIAAVRIKRLTLLIEYQKLESIELGVQHGRAGQQLEKQTEMLEKELIRLTNLLTKCDDRIMKITALREEMGLIEDLQQELEDLQDENT